MRNDQILINQSSFPVEALFPLQMLGGALVCAAVVLVQAAPRVEQKKTASGEA